MIHLQQEYVKYCLPQEGKTPDIDGMLRVSDEFHPIRPYSARKNVRRFQVQVRQKF